MKPVLAITTLAVLALASSAPTVGAKTVACEQAIAKAGSRFLQARVKVLQKCNDRIVKSGGGSCPNDKATVAIAKADAKLLQSIGKACGGADKVCGGDTSGEDLPASIGWPATCPNFAKGDCTNPITSCRDVATCIECIADAASDQAMTLSYGGDLPLPGDRAITKCRETIGAATSSFLAARSKALRKCRNAVINGTIPGPCPDPGTGKTVAEIEKAESKMIASICAACGGADATCGTPDDLTAAEIGFATTCPPVTAPGGESCGGAIADASGIAACVDCVAKLETDCVDRLQVPALAPYPVECDVCAEPPATGPCPTALTFTADGPNVDLDTGFTGIAHDAQVPTNGRITLAVSGCAGASQPTCGRCDVSGPIDNSGGPTFANHRCRDASWVPCANDADCAAARRCIGGPNNAASCTNASGCPSGSCDLAGFDGPCVYFFGAPLPLVAGGVDTCVVNEISGPIAGTIDLDDGTNLTQVPLRSNVFLATGACPHCNAGTCDNGRRIGQTCTITGHSDFFGDVSLDCPPDPGTFGSTLTIDLNLATGTQTKTVEAANPRCRETGYTALQCLCDTCAEPNQLGCSTNADCPASDFCLGGTNDGKRCSDASECPGGSCVGADGICGGRRCIGGPEDGKPCDLCLGGSNHGGKCANSSACPGGACSAGCAGQGKCNFPGEPTKPNSCIDDTSTPGLDCVDVGNNQGECAVGPYEQTCSRQVYKNCTVDADCQPAHCADCVPDQTCGPRTRPCFTDNGRIGNTVKVSGRADVPCGRISKPTVGAFFCVSPVGQGAINRTAGLPGLGRIRIPGVVDLGP